MIIVDLSGFNFVRRLRGSTLIFSLFCVTSGFGHSSKEPHTLIVMTSIDRDRVTSEFHLSYFVHWRKASVSNEMLLCKRFSCQICGKSEACIIKFSLVSPTIQIVQIRGLAMIGIGEVMW